MILSAGSKIFTCGNNIIDTGQGLVINITGNSFPIPSSQSVIGTLLLSFNAPTLVTINYGNGAVLNYETNTSNIFEIYNVGYNVTGFVPTSGTFMQYNYPDGLNINRTVTINFNRESLIGFQLNSCFVNLQPLDFEFANYPNLRRFYLQGVDSSNNVSAITSLNFESAQYVVGLNQVYIAGAFNSISPYYTSIPSQLLSMSIVTLSIGSPGFSTVTFEASNVANLINLASTLNSLTIVAPYTDNNFGEGALPSNFYGLTNLRTLSLQTVLYTTIPTVINSMPGLTSITILCAISGYSSSPLTNWGNLSNLVNLVSLNLNNSSLPATLPSWLSNLTKLKNLYLNGYGRNTPGLLDTLISNIYTFIVTNAPITGTSTSNFRSMNITVAPNSTGDGTQIPSGVYQQPPGYVQGSSNGTPTTSLQEIWVMTEQYGHNWTYRTS